MIAILRLIIIRIIRLLQVNVTRHHWLLVSALTSCSECLRTSYHWRPAQAPHHSDPAAASLAPGPRTSHLQARLVGFRSVARSVAAVSRGWLSAACRYRSPSTPIVRLKMRLVLSCGLTRLSAIVVSVAGPRTWNSLPIKLRQPDLSLEQFRRLLKTHLFS